MLERDRFRAQRIHSRLSKIFFCFIERKAILVLVLTPNIRGFPQMTSFRCLRRNSFDKFPGNVFPFKRTADGELKKENAP